MGESQVVSDVLNMTVGQSENSSARLPIGIKIFVGHASRGQTINHIY